MVVAAEPLTGVSAGRRIRVIVGIDRSPAYHDSMAGPITDAVVLIPIKAFHAAKGRLGSALSPAERERLARWTAERVLLAAGETPVAVVCDDSAVAEWAQARGAIVLTEPGLGLNGAVNHAIGVLRERGADHVTVVHGDLPRPSRLATFARAGTITIVPDTELGGTNLLSLPTDIGFEVEYGPGSFQRHLIAAMCAKVAVEVIRDHLMGLDLDHPRDLDHPLVAPLVKEVLPRWEPTNRVSQFPTR
jgi:2-phospho-L-lactate/phosphoenolpyruvate guanylyltransferase